MYNIALCLGICIICSARFKPGLWNIPEVFTHIYFCASSLAVSEQNISLCSHIFRL